MIKGWSRVPFPSSLHLQTDVIYHANLDEGTLMIKGWAEMEPGRGMYQKVITRELGSLVSAKDLVAAWEEPSACLDCCRHPPCHPHQRNQSRRPCEELLPIESLVIPWTGPARMNELQTHFFTDFVLHWGSYLADARAWRSEPVLFRSLSLAMLRIAAWDFRVVKGILSVGTTPAYHSLPH